MVSDAISAGNVQAINYFVAQKYVDALQAIATSNNQKLVLMPLEASSVIGAIAGIAELARDSFGGPGGGPGGGEGGERAAPAPRPPAAPRRPRGSVPSSAPDAKLD
jgi:hypothetical protein